MQDGLRYIDFIGNSLRKTAFAGMAFTRLFSRRPFKWLSSYHYTTPDCAKQTGPAHVFSAQAALKWLEGFALV